MPETFLAVATSDDGVSHNAFYCFSSLFFMSPRRLPSPRHRRHITFANTHVMVRPGRLIVPGKTIGLEWSASASAPAFCGTGILLCPKGRWSWQQYNRHRYHGYS